MQAAFKQTQCIQRVSALNNEVWQHCHQQSSNVLSAIHFPYSYWLPTFAFGASRIPSKRSTKRFVRPVHHFACCRINRDLASNRCSVMARFKLKVSLTIEQASHIGYRSYRCWNCYCRVTKAIRPCGYASFCKSALHRTVGCSKFRGNGSHGNTILGIKANSFIGTLYGVIERSCSRWTQNYSSSLHPTLDCGMVHAILLSKFRRCSSSLILLYQYFSRWTFSVLWHKYLRKIHYTGACDNGKP